MRFLRRNVLWVYGVFAAAVVSGLIVPPILLHSLGDTQLGVWLFIGSITGYLRVLDLGVGPSIVRFGATHRGEQDEEATNALASVGLVVYALIGTATLFAGLVLAVVIPALVDVPPGDVWEVRAATVLVVAGIAVDFVIGIFVDLLGAQQRYDVINFAGFVSIVLYVALVASVLTRTGGLVLLSAILLVTTIVRLGLPIFWVRRELPFLRPSRRYVSRERVRELMSFSWHNFLIHVSARASYGTDVVVVGLVLGAAAATVYGLPARLFAVGFAFSTAAPSLIYPAVAEAEGAGDPERASWYLRGGLRLGMLLVVLVAFPLILIPHDLLVAWGIGAGKQALTPHQLDEASVVTALLGVALMLNQPLHVATRYMVAKGKPGRIARILLGTVVVNIVVSVVLAEAVGVWGVAVGTLAGELVALAFVPALVARSSGLSLGRLAGASLRPVLPAVAVALVVFGIARLWHPQTKLELLPVAVVWTVACTAAVWFFGLGPEDRGAIRRNVGRGTRTEPALAGGAGEPLS